MYNNQLTPQYQSSYLIPDPGQVIAITPIVAGYNGSIDTLTVTFTDTSTGVISSWFWDFGDGNTSIEQNPVHIYDADGSYDVTLTVTGPAGTNSITQSSSVSSGTPAPIVSIDVESGTTLLLTFNETVHTPSSIDGWTLKADGVSTSLVSVDESEGGADQFLTMFVNPLNPIGSGQVVTVSYNSATGHLTDNFTDPIPSFTDFPANNPL